MVGAPHGREGDLGVGRPHGDSQRGGGRALGVGGRVGVANHQALALQDDGLRVVLRPRRGAAQRQGQQDGGQQPPAHGPHPRPPAPPLRAPLRPPRRAPAGGTAGSSGSRSPRAHTHTHRHTPAPPGNAALKVCLPSSGFFPPSPSFFLRLLLLLLLPPQPPLRAFFLYLGPFMSSLKHAAKAAEQNKHFPVLPFLLSLLIKKKIEKEEWGVRKEGKKKKALRWIIVEREERGHEEIKPFDIAMIAAAGSLSPLSWRSRML